MRSSDFEREYRLPEQVVRIDPIPLIDGIELRHFRFEIAGAVVEEGSDFVRSMAISGMQECRLVLRTRVMDRDLGHPIEVIFNDRFPRCASRTETIEWVRRAIVRAVTHEVAECLVLDGVRVLDPHKGER